MLAHSASLATKYRHRLRTDSSIVASLAMQCLSAPIAVLQILHLLSLRVPFVSTRLLCGARLATLTISLRNAFANLVRKLLYLAHIAMPHTSPPRGVHAKIFLALRNCMFVLIVSIVMDLRKPT